MYGLRVRSPTQRLLAADEVAAKLTKALAIDVCSVEELSGGGFAAVWRAALADGREAVIKIGPPDEVPLLEYEAGMIAAEATYLRLAAGRAPVPEVWYADDEAVVTSFRPGTPMPEIADDDLVRQDLGAVIARIHGVAGDRFGYSGDRPHGATWPEAFGAIMASLLRDGAHWGVPVPAERITSAVATHHSALAEVTAPALVHFDLWDGNVLATVDDSGRYRLSGLVDGERYLFGDPLIDLVSPVLFRRIEDMPDHPFLAGYTSAAPLVLNDSAVIRLGLYRMHLYVLMLVEMPSRGMTTPDDEPRRTTLYALLDEQLTALAA